MYDNERAAEQREYELGREALYLVGMMPTSLTKEAGFDVLDLARKVWGVISDHRSASDVG